MSKQSRTYIAVFEVPTTPIRGHASGIRMTKNVFECECTSRAQAHRFARGIQRQYGWKWLQSQSSWAIAEGGE